MYTNDLHKFFRRVIVSLTDTKGRDFSDKAKNIHFRIEEKLLERFEAALHYEGLKENRRINARNSAILHEGGMRKDE